MKASSYIMDKNSCLPSTDPPSYLPMIAIIYPASTYLCIYII